MSLLMQALKKAERAKQNSVSDEELDKPSEAFDEVLALTPDSAPPPPAPAAPAREFNLEGLSLEPMAPTVAAAAAPRPTPSPEPAMSDHKEPGLTLDLAPDPAAPASPAAPAASAPSASAHPAAASTAGASAAARAAAGLDAESAAPAPQAASAQAAPRTAAKPAAGTTAGAAAQASAASKAAAAPAGGDKPRAAARARARAAATAEPTGIDPERLRLIGLIAVLVLVVGGFGLYYWRALTAPGAGADLPPVPMPPPGATGATPAQAVVASIAPGGAAPTAPAADPDDPMLAPSPGLSRAAQQALEQRIARTEEELAATRQAMQAAAAAVNAPRPEQMPPLSAPDSGEIRVARNMQTSPVAPALDGAYSAFNSGDLNTAQQQYGEALAQDPNNRDALLGAAAVAARQNQKDKAASYYLRLLELSPNDGAATAGLIGLRQGDISLSEARLKGILNTNPEAAPVLFALGNLYAQQGRWPDAQQAYFRAVGSAPDNPDYAYNLAVGLDRLNQPKLALTYYQRALALAQDKAVGFDRNALRKRMHELGLGSGAH
ncbi:tetratricopeptide repeat protein [Duganella sp.]|uniref:tetratricopeptide repeat protein n=1 Tax=Duganella sp. TaxID=1904440 RepID=UPI0031E1E8C4